jgi:hypothetical protein
MLPPTAPSILLRDDDARGTPAAAAPGPVSRSRVLAAGSPAHGPGRDRDVAMLERRRWNGSVEAHRVRDLARDEVVRLPRRPEGSSVRVEAGLLLVTREGDDVDHVLEAGAELEVPGRGLAVAWALEASRIEVRERTTDGAAGGVRESVLARAGRRRIARVLSALGSLL